MKLNMNKEELRKFLLHAPQDRIMKYIEGIHPVDILDILREDEEAKIEKRRERELRKERELRDESRRTTKKKTTKEKPRFEEVPKQRIR